MELIAHRINTAAELIKLEENCGVELDLRDNLEGRIYISHHPYENGEDFEAYLKQYRHGTMILNIKSERIEYKVLELLKKYTIRKYFFLDCSFPMIYALSGQGEKNIALRFSEYEGMDTIRNMAGKVSWVWVDCFTKLPLTREYAQELRQMGYRICIVSPELQGQPGQIGLYKKQMEDMQVHADAVCTKVQYMNKWK